MECTKEQEARQLSRAPPRRTGSVRIGAAVLSGTHTTYTVQFGLCVANASRPNTELS
jgi:hypothetical protein